MKYDMILAGVGGQGVLSIAAIVAVAAVESDLHLKQAEVHGMSQRGGAVQSHLRLSDQPIFSDLIPLGKADMLLSMEPMEALRYVPFLATDGVIVVERTPVVNIPNYPNLEDIIQRLEARPRTVLVDAENIAREMRAARSSVQQPSWERLRYYLPTARLHDRNPSRPASPTLMTKSPWLVLIWSRTL